MRRCSAIVSVFLVLITAGDASAQYFGKNKVQYRDFDFKVLKTIKAGLRSNGIAVHPDGRRVYVGASESRKDGMAAGY